MRASFLPGLMLSLSFFISAFFLFVCFGSLRAAAAFDEEPAAPCSRGWAIGKVQSPYERLSALLIYTLNIQLTITAALKRDEPSLQYCAVKRAR